MSAGAPFSLQSYLKHQLADDLNLVNDVVGRAIPLRRALLPIAVLVIVLVAGLVVLRS